jgi:hypothetical protein
MATLARRSITAFAGMITLTACFATMRPGPDAVYVRQGPPREVVEVRLAPPSREYVWIPGRHEWRSTEYIWMPGRYALPPSESRRRYQPGKWTHAKNGWFWTDGRWR